MSESDYHKELKKVVDYYIKVNNKVPMEPFKCYEGEEHDIFTDDYINFLHELTYRYLHGRGLIK